MRAGWGIAAIGLGLTLVGAWWLSVRQAGGPLTVDIVPAQPEPGDRPICRVGGVGARTPVVSWWRGGQVLLASRDPRWPEGEPLRAGEVIACRVGRPSGPGGAAEARAVVRSSRQDGISSNMLLLVADDLGVDKLSAYGPPVPTPHTPNLDRLAARGIRFDRAYADAICSPTRATLLTGRYAARTGVGTGVIAEQRGGDLGLEEITLAEALAGAPRAYTSVALGKWHLASARSDVLRHPLQQGFSHFAGTVSNLAGLHAADQQEQSYTDWEKNVDGVLSRVRSYATTETVDDAIAAASRMPEPWFLYVAFHAPHTPVHTPPRRLLREDLPESPSKLAQYDAMVEALDKEIGRLLAAIGPERLERTHVFFVGDNGTPSHGTRPALDPERTKGTLFEGGVHVPLLVMGPAVARPGASSSALVNTVDVFSTILELAEVSLPLRTEQGDEVALDGVSLVPYLADPELPSLRSWAYVESFSPNGCVGSGCEHYRQGLIGERYKLLKDGEGRQRVFDLRGRWVESLEEPDAATSVALQSAMRRLEPELTRLTDRLLSEAR